MIFLKSKKGVKIILQVKLLAFIAAKKGFTVTIL